MLITLVQARVLVACCTQACLPAWLIGHKQRAEEGQAAAVCPQVKWPADLDRWVLSPAPARCGTRDSCAHWPPRAAAYRCANMSARQHMQENLHCAAGNLRRRYHTAEKECGAVGNPMHQKCSDKRAPQVPLPATHVVFRQMKRGCTCAGVCSGRDAAGCLAACHGRHVLQGQPVRRRRQAVGAVRYPAGGQGVSSAWSSHHDDAGRPVSVGTKNSNPPSSLA